MSVQKENFGILPDGKAVDTYKIKNNNGVQFSITNYGCRVTSLSVPDKHGNSSNVVLGYATLKDYLNDEYYLGAIVGRFANRIAKGKFNVDGNTYKLAINNGANHIHGGEKGFDRAVWKASEIKVGNGNGVKLFYSSKDGEEGYPGKLDVNVTFVLTEENELKITYSAITDKTTPINLTHHGYFNLSGDFSKSILDNKIKLYSDKIVESDQESIPTGKILSTSSSPFDFNNFETIGKRINENDNQLQNGNGYDHSFIFEEENKSLKLVAELLEPGSGRLMEVYTTEPAIQFYTGNYLCEKNTNGKFGKRTGLCLETQHYPDSPNHLEFPTTILHPGEVFTSQTIYKFKIR